MIKKLVLDNLDKVYLDSSILYVVRAMSIILEYSDYPSSCINDKKQHSNWDGGMKTPLLRSVWKNMVNFSVSAVFASS